MRGGRVRVMVTIPAELYDAARAAARGEAVRVNTFIVSAVAEMVRDRAYCTPRAVGRRVSASVALPRLLYDRVRELVDRGVYPSISAVVTAALARRLGACGPSAEPREWATLPCGFVDTSSGWGRVVEFVKCALKVLARGARGTAVAFNVRWLCRWLLHADGHCPVLWMADAIYRAVEEVAGQCVVAHYKKPLRRGSRVHRVILDVRCLRERLGGGP